MNCTYRGTQLRDGMIMERKSFNCSKKLLDGQRITQYQVYTSADVYRFVNRGDSGGRLATQVGFQSWAVEYYPSIHSEGSRQPVSEYRKE